MRLGTSAPRAGAEGRSDQARSGQVSVGWSGGRDARRCRGGRLWRLVERRPGHPQLVHRQPARRLDPGDREALHGRVERPLHGRRAAPAVRRHSATRAAGSPPGRQGLDHRHRRHGRCLDRGVRQRRLDQPVPCGAGQAGHPECLSERGQDRLLRGQALRRAVQLQHPAPLVPKGPGAEAADDLEPDDRRGREAGVRGKAGHDPGAGQQVRGLHGLGQRADRVGGRADPLRPGDRLPASRSRRRRRSR